MPPSRCISGTVFAIAASLAVYSASTGAEPAQCRPWTEYRTIMWIGNSAWKKPEKLPLFFQRLREMGINTAMASGDADPGPVGQSGFPYYVENIINRGLCLKWNSKVKDWNQFVSGWARNGRPESAFIRDYCLDDPQWQSWACTTMQQAVRRNMANNPLAYDIRDELSTTISANPFDYDFSPVTLQKFREWLKTQYTDLAALNAEWETQFSSWDDVRPFSTDEIKNRMASGDAMPRGKPDWHALEKMKFDPAEARKQPSRWNFAPWCDFRTYMDISLASTLSELRDAAHAVDPHTPVGVEGTQMPAAFGGYDLWRISQAVDWAEPYDMGNAREILGSFMQGKPMLTTVFENDTNHATRRLWHLLLEGDGGCIVWWSEDCIDWNSADYALTPKALALAPALNEMTSPLARLFLRATREYDPIAIHYSQPSIQIDWLLESTADGATWQRRFSSYEASHNRMAKVRNSWLKALQDLGYSPYFVSSERLLTEGFAAHPPAALVLPESLALKDGEEELISRLVKSGVPLLSSGAPGMFDGHGRLRGKSKLNEWYPLDFLPAAQWFTKSTVGEVTKTDLRGYNPDVTAYQSERLTAKKRIDFPIWIAEALPQLKPEVAVPPDTHVRVHRYKLGAARLLAFERNIDYHMSEDLKEAGGNGELEKPVTLEVKLNRAAHVYNLRTRKYLGETDRIAFILDPWQPSLFALLGTKEPAETILEELAKQGK